VFAVLPPGTDPAFDPQARKFANPKTTCRVIRLRMTVFQGWPLADKRFPGRHAESAFFALTTLH
jgi:hypothetical protein